MDLSCGNICFIMLFVKGKPDETSQSAFTCSKLTIETPEQRCEICSKLTIKPPKRRGFGGIIVNFEHILHLFSSASIVNFEHVNAGYPRLEIN